MCCSARIQPPINRMKNALFTFDLTLNQPLLLVRFRYFDLIHHKTVKQR